MKKSSLVLILILLVGIFLRFYLIDKNPPGLYIDEASIGNNAHRILTTGHDEHGVQMPLFFKAFGEYKLPVYIYLTVVSFFLFGVNEIALRFPSVMFGSLTLLVMYFFVRELFLPLGKKKLFSAKPEQIALLTTGLLAIMPWHIHFSRGGFEATIALFFYLLGCLMMLLFWRKSLLFYILIACLSFGISIYTYSIYKIISLITFFTFLGAFYYMLPKLRKMLLIISGIFLLLSLPMVVFSLTQEGNARFLETTAFSEYPINNSIEALIFYPMVLLKNYMTFFALDFLFSHGDGNGRHQMPGMGLLFKWQLPFLFIGLFWLLSQKNTITKFFIFGLLLLAPLVPAVARPSPNSLRSLLMVIPLTILISCGLLYSLQFVKKVKYVYVVVLMFVAGYTFIQYIHKYYAHYPIVNALDWGSAYKETIQKVVQRKDNYTHIIFDNNLSFAKSYVQFYAPTIKVDYKPPDWKELKELEGNVLYVSIYYGDRNDAKRLDQVYLPGPNKNVHTQLWEL